MTSRLCQQILQAVVVTLIEGGSAQTPLLQFCQEGNAKHRPLESPPIKTRVGSLPKAQSMVFCHLLGKYLRVTQNCCCVGFVHSSGLKLEESHMQLMELLRKGTEPGVVAPTCGSSTREAVSGQLEPQSKLSAIRVTEQPCQNKGSELRVCDSSE